MCVPDVSPIHIYYAPPVIYSYLVGELQARVTSAVNAGNNKAPERDYDDDIDEAERKLIDCLVDKRKGSFATMLNSAYINTIGHKIKIEPHPDQSCGNDIQGDYNRIDDVLRINRRATMDWARAQSATDTEAQEYKLFLRAMSENFIHEFCHEENSHSSTDDPNSSIYTTPGYWNGSHGQCVANGWSLTIGGLSPLNDKFAKQGTTLPPVYNLDTCMNVIFSAQQHQDYLKSVRSASAACDAAPQGTQLQYNSGPNPHI